MKGQRRGILAAFALAVVGFVMVISFMFIFGDKKARESDLESAIDDKPASSSANKPSRRDEQLEKAIVVQKLRKIIADEIDSDQNHHEYLAALYARRRQLKEKVSPYAWEMTPSVLGEILDEQPLNQSWTETVEEQALVALESPENTGTSLVSVDCGSNLCRTTQLHENKEAFETFRGETVTGAPWGGVEQHGSSEEIEGGKIKSVVYFAFPRNLDAFNEALERIAELAEDL